MRQDGEMPFRESRGSRRKAEGKQQKASARGYFEAEEAIRKDRREKNAFAAAWQESDSEGDGLETREKLGKGTGWGKCQRQAGRAGETGRGQALSA